jgi:hypothetical protein
MMGLLKVLVFVQLMIALALFSGTLTVDQVTEGVDYAGHAITTLCARAANHVRAAAQASVTPQ